MRLGSSSVDDGFRRLRTSVAVGVMTFGGSFGIGFLMAQQLKQLLLAVVGIAAAGAAIACMAVRERRLSTQWLWLALALFAALIALMVLVHNFWPPLYSRNANGALTIHNGQ